jgi:RNA polymerase sigma factor (sigma-70 family)
VEDRASETVLHHLHTLFNVGIVSGLTDGQLLEQFACRGGEAAEVAFAALVQRHGPVVLSACLGIVGNDHDAQDAFQATFFILARKSSTLWVRESLGPWLHRVACRAAVRIKVTSGRRRATERHLAEMAGNRVGSGSGISDDIVQALHEAVDRLPDHYRRPVVLCDLEGHSYEEAARQLGCPVGTVRSRLARGRERLRGRLVRRGLISGGQSGPAIVRDVAPKSVPAALMKSTIEIVLHAHRGNVLTAGAVSTSVTALAEGVLRAMLLTKIKTAIALTVAAGVTMVGLGLLARGSAHEHPSATPESAQTKSETINTAQTAASEPTLDPRVEATPRPKSPYAAPPPILTLGNFSQTKVWAYHPETKTWHTYTAPKGVQAACYGKPTADLVAPGFSGEQITEIAVFSAKAGKWSRQALNEPVKGQFSPFGGGTHLALYLSGRHAYAFSSLTGRWSHQTLTEAADVRFSGNPLVADDFAVYTDYFKRRHVYGFSALTGTWEMLEVEEGTSSRADKGPSGTALVVGRNRLYSFDAKTGHFQEVPSKED